MEKSLRHPHQCVIDRAVAMGVIFTHDVADDAGTLPRRLAVVVTTFAHCIENAAVNRLQPIPHIGERARNDHAHRIIEIGALHLLFDGDDV